jgi:hypothetical protein
MIRLFSTVLVLVGLTLCFSALPTAAVCGPCSSWQLGNPPQYLTGQAPYYCGDLCYGTVYEYTYDWVANADPNNWSYVDPTVQWAPDGVYLFDCRSCGGGVTAEYIGPRFNYHLCTSCGQPPYGGSLSTAFKGGKQ